MRDELRDYYDAELSYIRETATAFAKKYPKVASRLNLDEFQSRDPHVERLIEAFAFLSARVHLKIDDEFPEVTDALLNVIYPERLRPIPSMSIVEFKLSPDAEKLAGPTLVKRNSVMQSRPVGETPCSFRSCYDTTLWPLSVTAAEWRSPNSLQLAGVDADCTDAIRLEVKCNPGVTFRELQVDSLRFFLDGETGFIHGVYELLFHRLSRIVVRNCAAQPDVPAKYLNPAALRPVGFKQDEGMMPYPRQSFVGHQLLLEYFAFPEKFFFVDLTGLAELWKDGQQVVEFIFLLKNVDTDERRRRLKRDLSPKTFRLGCSPVVNLFSRMAEPIQLSHRKHEYSIVPNVRWPNATEVFSVDDVAWTSSQGQQPTVIDPFYSLRHSTRSTKRQCFWLERRRPSVSSDKEGTDTFLSLIQLSADTTNLEIIGEPSVELSPEEAKVRQLLMDGKRNTEIADVLGKDIATVEMHRAAILQKLNLTLLVRTTCINRDLPNNLNVGEEFQPEDATSVSRIVALRKPTPTLRLASGRGSFWRLISHLSLNHLSLVKEGTEALKEILRLFENEQSSFTQGLVDSILQVDSSPDFARVTSEHGISFARGVQVELQFDESHFVDGGVYLFASILERFLGLSVSLNSFTRLIVTTPQRKGRKEKPYAWMPRAGSKILI